MSFVYSIEKFSIYLCTNETKQRNNKKVNNKILVTSVKWNLLKISPIGR